MKFYEYIEERIKDEEEFDVVIGGAEMPVTLGFCSDWVLTDYCREKYEDLLNSDITVYKDPTGKYLDAVEVEYDDWEEGEKFCCAVAGYVSESEWDKLFSKDGAK